MTPPLQLANVGFGYADRNVLANVDFTLQEGSCTALIGANGAGKTTLLRLASGTREEVEVSSASPKASVSLSLRTAA